jgi:hypothetical protein
VSDIVSWRYRYVNYSFRYFNPRAPVSSSRVARSRRRRVKFGASEALAMRIVNKDAPAGTRELSAASSAADL